MEGKKQSIIERLKGLKKEELPDLSTPEGFAKACQECAKIVGPELRAIDCEVVRSRARAHLVIA